MRSIRLLSVLTFAIPFLVSPVAAQVEINGSVRTDYRVRTGKPHNVTWNENRLDLKIRAGISNQAVAFGEIWFRSFGFPKASQAEQLSYRDRRYLLPWAFDLRQAYLELYGFPIANLDLRIGKQRIAWGTADKINPTDNLNPKDFEDPLDFGRKLPVNALRANLYVGDWSLELDYIPVFTPAVLPPPDWRFGGAVFFPTGSFAGVQEVSTELALPPPTFKDGASVGVKLAGSIGGYDASFSYAYVRDDLPILTEVLTTVTGGGVQRMRATLSFPRLHVFGADLAGEFLGAGVWAEAAAFLPAEDVYRTTRSTVEAVLPPPQLVLKREVYTKWVVGGDYTLRNGLYVNGQFIHGFYGERGCDGLQDYLVFTGEKSFRHDSVKLKLAVLFQTKRIRDPLEDYTWVVFPEISFYPTNSVELILGGYAIQSKGHTSLSTLAANDEVFAKVKVSF